MGHTAVNPNTVHPVTNLRDWLAVEADYRAGLLSLRQIAAKAGNLTEAAIRKRAKRLGWSRDLTARIRSRASELVHTVTVRSVGSQYATDSEAVETAIIEDNANVLAHVEVTQRKHISRARAIVMNLFADLEASSGDRTGQLIRSPSEVRQADCTIPVTQGTTGNRGLTLSARAAAAKSLSDAMRTLVALERQSWRMDLGEPDPASARPVIDSSKLTFDERQQLRAMILRASSPA